MKKRIFCTIIGVCMIFSLIQMPALADEYPSKFLSSNNGISPLWVNTSTITLNMSYSRGTVSWSGLVKGDSNVTKISVTYTLYKQDSSGNYSRVDSWSDSTTSTILISSGSASGTAGTYKLVISGTVTAPGYAEPITMDIVRTLS